MKKKYILLLIIAGIVVALDQMTKIYIHTRFQLGESLVVIENIFNFTYVRNYEIGRASCRERVLWYV